MYNHIYIYMDIETRKRSRRSSSKTKKSKPKLFKKLTKYLKIICNDSGECMALGHKEKVKIKHMFDNYENFKFAEPTAKRVGSDSANGFVYEITYNKNGYKSNTLLKSSVRKDSDNLYYEYLVGTNFINKMNYIFPCFTETYQLLRNNDDVLKKNMRKGPLINVNRIEENYEFLGKNEIKNIKESCMNSDKLAILVQYLKHPYTIDNDFEIIDDDNENFLDTELAQLLYQIYCPLSALKNCYTHYDLHNENILLYKLKENTFITMRYIFKNEVIQFNTKYLVKIIDYGRSFFKIDNSDNSKTILQKICEDPICNKDQSCGDESGYAWNQIPTAKDFENGTFENNHFICSSMRNISHDLRFVKTIEDMFPGPVNDILSKVVYSGEFGTEELHSEQGERVKESLINNVSDMESELKKYILYDDNFRGRNQQLYDNNENIGILTIFVDEKKEMVFRPNISTRQHFKTKYPDSYSNKK
jgi:hypothetical protein